MEEDELVRIITLAPELPGAVDFIKKAVEQDIICSMGHTAADYATALKAFEAGASRVTHMFNAMNPLAHRDPGLIGAAFDTEEVMAEIIPDGIHIHPSIVRASIDMFGESRIVFVSDSLAGTGMPDGQYTIGNIQVNISNHKALRVDNGAIAGSALNLMDCVRKAVLEMGISMETAVRLASMNPAVSLGLFDQLGSITPGKYADIVLVDEELNIKAVIIKGNLIINRI